MIQWRNFKTDPPYDAQPDMDAGYETDYQWGYFIYRYKNRPYLENDPLRVNKFLSPYPSYFYDGIFSRYESHMRTSPYPSDWIEVLWWCDIEDVRKTLLESFPLKVGGR